MTSRWWRSEHREGEEAWPWVLALIVALGFYVFLPGTFRTPIRWAVVTLSLLLSLFLLGRRHVREPKHQILAQRFALGVAAVILLGNQVVVVELIRELVSGASHGPYILLVAVHVWATNVIGYGFVFWGIDRGGPDIGLTNPSGRRHFQFPKPEEADWAPKYFDYLYFSASTAMAFSPTDVMPLTHRAKALMLAEALTGFVLVVLVIGRSFSIIG